MYGLSETYKIYLFNYIRTCKKEHIKIITCEIRDLYCNHVLVHTRILERKGSLNFFYISYVTLNMGGKLMFYTYVANTYYIA